MRQTGQNFEQELIRRLLARDRRAVWEFYRAYGPRLLRFIKRKVMSAEDTEEIAQDTLFAFLESIRDFSRQSSLNTYLCAIARHKIVDYYRKKRLKRILFSQIPEGMESFMSETASPHVAYENTLVAQKILSVLSRLTPQYSRMLILKYVEGRSVAEIARHLTMSFKAAESILFRARKAFVKVYTRETA